MGAPAACETGSFHEVRKVATKMKRLILWDRTCFLMKQINFRVWGICQGSQITLHSSYQWQRMCGRNIGV